MKSSRSTIRYIIISIIVVLIIAALKIGSVYKQVYGPNIKTPDGKDFYLYIHTGADYNSVISLLDSGKILRNRKSFEWAANKKKYQDHVHPGRYLIKNNMSNNELINKLRAGLQEPVNLVINTARTSLDLAGKISRQIEADSIGLCRLMTDENFLKQYEMNSQTVIGMFLPNTYEFWWNTSGEDFFKRMHKEYTKFWNSERTSKAKEIGLSANQVITLASIIISESNKEDEYRRIAGLYINRLHKGMRLQADPTVKFALNDFDRQRILNSDIIIDSPYNTYMHEGLPPGPIALPTINAIDAVLSYEKHDYLYFCAREDFSGYHNFARTLDQHNKNARLYQNALNRRKIFK